MDNKSPIPLDGTHTIPPDTLPSSIPSSAQEILATFLINNADLKMPWEVTNYASSVVFTPEVGSFLPTPLKMSESASALWAVIGLFANAICRERYNAGEPKKIVVDVYSATLMLCSVFLFQIDGKNFIESKVAPRAAHLDKGRNVEMYRNQASNIYKTSDERYFQLHGSLNATPTLQMLDLPAHRPDLQGVEHIGAIKDIYRGVMAERESMALEAEANERWLQPGATCRTIDEYAATSHGKSNIQESLYKIYTSHEQLPPSPWPQQSQMRGQPLAGIKVLDLTKVIAGPTVTRVLALMGADVLRVSTDTQPDALPFIADGQLGKRDANIDLKSAEGKRQLDELLKEADVVVNSYRPGVFEKLGLGRNWAHELARRRGKGIVYCRVNCYGWTGEWSGRPGYQPVSDAVTGASWEQGKFLGLEEPVMPLFPNSDSQTGLAGGIAIMQALLRRASEGGCYNVDIALNTYNNWLIREVGLHASQTKASLRALHPGFLPRHHTGFFEMVPMLLQTTMKSNGTGPGQLWDRARFTKGIMRWGLEGEEATYLDWRRIVSVESQDGKPEVVFDFESGSCMPGSDEAKWL
ncbi:CoA-transferase family III [Microthyrium microscopicum]|uniref:CoA-transferase family III n=1 Tax=Microthyrium microscopicum TaxID=703497 RepID=A0A6A6UDM1_9PEZI|nr:CoA-transferase family III [Microthyrium microscopicum]